MTAMTAVTARQRLLSRSKPVAVQQPAEPQPLLIADLWARLQPGEKRILDLQTGCEWSEFEDGSTKIWN